jgi:hypothetical protein
VVRDPDHSPRPFNNHKKFAIGWVLKFAALYLLVSEDY